jgi:hypothetical protein
MLDAPRGELKSHGVAGDAILVKDEVYCEER